MNLPRRFIMLTKIAIAAVVVAASICGGMYTKPGKSAIKNLAAKFSRKKSASEVKKAAPAAARKSRTSKRPVTA
jgi:hypothetical protein